MKKHNCKKHNTIKISIISILIFIAIFPVFGNAADTKYANASISTTETNPYNSVVITPQSSMYATIQIDSQIPGTFEYTNYLGSPIGSQESVPDVDDPELYYPVRMDTPLAYYSNYGIPNEKNTYYVNVENNSQDFGNYDVSLVTAKNEIRDGETIEFFITDAITEVDVRADKPGIYRIWYNDITLNSINIISPSQKLVSSISDQLPFTYFDSGISMGKYFYFAAFETGYYRLYLTTGSPYIRTRCEFVEPTKIKYGEPVSDGVLPGSPEYLNPSYSMNVYSIAVESRHYVKYFLELEYGAPVKLIFYDHPTGTTFTPLTEGSNQIYSPSSSGTIFIVLDNPDYFTWDEPGLIEAFPIKFTMKIDEVRPQLHTTNAEEPELIAVKQLDGFAARYIDISQTSVLSLQFMDKGANSPVIFEGIPFVTQVFDGISMVPSVYESIYNNGIDVFINVLVDPGFYKVGFQHTGSIGTEYIQFNTTTTPAQSISHITKDPNVDLNITDFESIELESWSNISDSLGAAFGNVLEYNVDENFRNNGYNITFRTEDNQHIFENTSTPSLGFLWDDSTNTFTDYTDNIRLGDLTLVPIKTSGLTNGDAFIIGSTQKYDKIMVDTTQVSDTDAFIWQYYDGGWVTFNNVSHDFIDETNGALGTLQYEGNISWNPDLFPSWDTIQRTTNSTTLELPDTNDIPMYLIRCLCTDSSASIPNITSVNIHDFIKIQFDLEVEMCFGVNLLGTSRYDESAGAADWISGIIVDNLDDTVSIQDEDFNRNINFYYQKGVMFLSSEDIGIFDWYGNNGGTLTKLDETLVLKLVHYKLDNYFQEEFTIDSVLHANYTNTMDFPLNEGFNETISYNASEKNLLYIKVFPRTRYDWTRINLSVANGEIQSLRVIEPFVDRTYSVLSDTDFDWFPGIIDPTNVTFDFGFITPYILLEIEMDPLTLNPDFDTDIKIYGGQFGYPQISFTVGNPFIWKPWMTYTTIGCSVAGLAAIGVIIFVKKKGRFKV